MTFSDRNVSDAKDGYVSCDSFVKELPAEAFKHVSVMERAIQAVPTVTESAAQTDLKHPKNIAIQYEPRVFSKDEVTEQWSSDQMRMFLGKAEQMFVEISCSSFLLKLANDLS